MFMQISFLETLDVIVLNVVHKRRGPFFHAYCILDKKSEHKTEPPKRDRPKKKTKPPTRGAISNKVKRSIQAKMPAKGQDTWGDTATLQLVIAIDRVENVGALNCIASVAPAAWQRPPPRGDSADQQRCDRTPAPLAPSNFPMYGARSPKHGSLLGDLSVGSRLAAIHFAPTWFVAMFRISSANRSPEPITGPSHRVRFTAARHT